MPKIYLIKLYNKSECFYKIGYTKHKNINERFDKIPYEYVLIETVSTKDETDAFIAEQTILKDFSIRHFKYSPKISFSGESECFVGTDDNSMKLEFNKTIKRLFKIGKSNTLLVETSESLESQYNNDYSTNIQLNKFASEFLRSTHYDKISSIEEINEYTNFLIKKVQTEKIIGKKRLRKGKKFNIHDIQQI